MIDMHSKYDNMHKNRIFYALIFININKITSINYMLSVTLSTRFPLSTEPSSSTPSPLLESSGLLASSTHGRDGGCSFKAATSCGGCPTTKGKETFPLCTYYDKTTHASENFWKQLEKSEWAQAMFSSTTSSLTLSNTSTPQTGQTIQMSFTPT